LTSIIETVSGGFCYNLIEGRSVISFKHSNILSTSKGLVITAMIFILLPHFGHIKGSTSYTFWISLAQLCLEALVDTDSISKTGGGTEDDRISNLLRQGYFSF